MDVAASMRSLGIEDSVWRLAPGPGRLPLRSPVDGALLGHVAAVDAAEAGARIGRARAAFERWREVPAPRRGELVRRFGEALREHHAALGELVSCEVGKIGAEARGEVQEMIDIGDFAVGLSRQLHGLTIASERPAHRMMETWHPLGVVGVVTAFNFPVAVLAWNAALAWVCGDAVVWKPSEKALLCALAVKGLFDRTCEHFGAPAGLLQLLPGGAEPALQLAQDPRIALLSATGSTRMGQALAPVVAARFGRGLLELGGNNAVVVAPSADLALAVRGVVFGAVGTAGQRCTSTRRLFVHEQVYGAVRDRLLAAYASVPIGSPLDDGTLLGPLIDGAAFDAMQAALARARREGGTVHGGERCLADRYPSAWYVRPALVEMPAQTAVVADETFAPILFLMRYRDFDEAIALHNAVPQGLSSAIFTNDLREAERFVGATGSDCGIANVNLGTSGAEIGGAFGGEKASGGGREAGSDAWKAYMRRATNTVNFGAGLPLAQGIRFEV